MATDDRMSAPFSVVALFIKDGQVLSVSRKKNHKDLGLPGGKIDPGETPEEALYREVDQETGIRIKAMYHIFDHLDRIENGERKPCRCFIISSWEGEPFSKEEGQVAWVHPSRLLDASCSFRDYNRTLFQTLRILEPM